jgi:hypothetical protein
MERLFHNYSLLYSYMEHGLKFIYIYTLHYSCTSNIQLRVVKENMYREALALYSFSLRKTQITAGGGIPWQRVNGSHVDGNYSML